MLLRIKYSEMLAHLEAGICRKLRFLFLGEDQPTFFSNLHMESLMPCCMVSTRIINWYLKAGRNSVDL